MDARPTLCGDCDRKEEEGIARSFDEYGWTAGPQPQHQEQVLPEQKAGGTWLSRFRR
ncbi:hypothetical protein [Streptomyces sp. NPDC047999]|uniref:hypothetical protein n=1 Tax=Streptomyces sp. NPDC047999 TaxID=3365497 RepID=UPI00371CA5DC